MVLACAAGTHSIEQAAARTTAQILQRSAIRSLILGRQRDAIV
jgi:hypothetical protein